MRWASIVFPVPGGPTSSRWCPPAAATSSARRASSCPTTSARSWDGAAGRAGGGPGRASTGAPSSQASTCPSVAAPYTSIPSTSAASGSAASGTTTRRRPAARAASRQGSTPRTGRRRPSSASSPTRTVSSSARCATVPAAASTPQASARSKPLPVLRSVAGESASTTRSFGHVRPELTTAARTRSRDSCSAVSGSPTRCTPGSPPPMSASISTTWPSTPRSATDHARASPIRTPPRSAAASPGGPAPSAPRRRRTGSRTTARGARPARPASRRRIRAALRV